MSTEFEDAIKALHDAVNNGGYEAWALEFAPLIEHALRICRQLEVGPTAKMCLIAEKALDAHYLLFKHDSVAAAADSVFKEMYAQLKRDLPRYE